MRSKTVDNLTDGCVRVCLSSSEEGRICSTVSSHHLVADKWPQLHRALDKLAGQSSDLEQ